MVTPNIDETSREGEVPVEQTISDTASADSTSDEKLIPQSEVDKIAAKVRREEAAKRSDYKYLQDRDAKLQEIEKSQLSEQERMTEKITDLEQQKNTALSQLTEAHIEASIQVTAAKLGVIDPQDISKLLNRENISYDSATGVTGVESALTQLLEEKPYLKGVSRSPNLNPETGQPTRVVGLTAAQKEAARTIGISEEQYAKGL